MPTYDFLCITCRHRFEGFLAKPSEASPGCPKCGKPVQRLIGGGAGFVVKSSLPAHCHSERPDGTCRRETEGVGCCGRKEPCSHD